MGQHQSCLDALEVRFVGVQCSPATAVGRPAMLVLVALVTTSMVRADATLNNAVSTDCVNHASRADIGSVKVGERATAVPMAGHPIPLAWGLPPHYYSAAVPSPRPAARRDRVLQTVAKPMSQVQPQARTTLRSRAVIRSCQAFLAELAQRYNVTVATVRK